jgi:hypothetical protein
MNYKPDEKILVSWLYGDLDEKEKERLESYFQENPEAYAKVKEMGSVLDILNTLKDKEVIAPPILPVESRGVVSMWRSSVFRTVTALAASFLIIMVAGRLIGMEINYHQGELKISFGGVQKAVPTDQPVASGLSPEQVQSMINNSLVQNNQLIASRLSDQDKKVNQSIRLGLTENSRKFDGIMKETAQASQEQVRTFVAGLQSENLRLMKDYLQLSSSEQKKYVESLLVDFSKYLQEQRSQDLTVFQARMNSMENNSNQFKQETEQILSGIISATNVTQKKNNY